MTLQEINMFIDDPGKIPEAGLNTTAQSTQSPDADEQGDFFNPLVLHNNFGGVPDIGSDPYEQYLQERVVFPANRTGKLALRLFKEGIEYEKDKCIQDGELQGGYTYWVRLLSDESTEGYSIEFGLRGGSERPTVQGIMARCAIENGLPSRDTSVSSLSAFVLELSKYEEIDQMATEAQYQPELDSLNTSVTI